MPEFPETWRPSPGDELTGTFVRLDEGAGKDGNTAKIVVLADADGVEHGVWLWHTVLRAGFARLRPKRGETVRVVYRGERRSGSDRTYHDYVVSAPEREEGAPDWDTLEVAQNVDERRHDDAEIPF
jgi:hypothetical protein